jgi:hypothetical protein
VTKNELCPMNILVIVHVNVVISVKVDVFFMRLIYGGFVFSDIFFASYIIACQRE